MTKAGIYDKLFQLINRQVEDKNINHILKKAKKHPLTNWEKKFNKLIGKTRFKVARTFRVIKRWFNAGVARYNGMAKMHTQNLLNSK